MRSSNSSACRNGPNATSSELSGGMQQRVGLARAFATDADILLMDEPFSALDPLIRGKLQDELLALQERVKKTILFVSHDLDEALRLGDRISILQNGRIVQTGTAEDIVLAPADDYVAEFVRHMNPLDVLYGRMIMRAADGHHPRGRRAVARRRGAATASIWARRRGASRCASTAIAAPLAPIQDESAAAGAGARPCRGAGLVLPAVHHPICARPRGTPCCWPRMAASSACAARLRSSELSPAAGTDPRGGGRRAER